MGNINVLYANNIYFKYDVLKKKLQRIFNDYAVYSSLSLIFEKLTYIFVIYVDEMYKSRILFWCQVIFLKSYLKFNIQKF